MTRYRHPSRKHITIEGVLTTIGWIAVFTLPVYIEALVDCLLAL